MAGKARWPLVMLGIVVGAVVVLALGLALTNWLRPPAVDAVDTVSTSSNTQVIASMRSVQEVALLSLGVQGIAERTEQRTIFGVRVPGAGREVFMQYDFKAKVGLDGQAVQFRELGDDELRISIPEFIFIGHDDVTFKVAVEKNGVLSWVTPEIDSVEMTNAILNDETQQQYLDDNEEILREQAQAFYKGIAHAIDPEIRLEFDYISLR